MKALALSEAVSEFVTAHPTLLIVTFVLLSLVFGVYRVTRVAVTQHNAPSTPQQRDP